MANGTIISDTDIALSILQVVGLTLPALGIFFSIVFRREENLKDRPAFSSLFFLASLLLFLAALLVIQEINSVTESIYIKYSLLTIVMGFLTLVMLSYLARKEAKEGQKEIEEILIQTKKELDKAEEEEEVELPDWFNGSEEELIEIARKSEEKNLRNLTLRSFARLHIRNKTLLVLLIIGGVLLGIGDNIDNLTLIGLGFAVLLSYGTLIGGEWYKSV